METTNNLFSDVGSFKDFAHNTGLDGPDAIAVYSKVLHERREAVAAQLGISLEDLHSGVKPAIKADFPQAA